MNLQDIGLTQNQQTILHRFIATCQRDERVAAAFLGGSFAKASNDAYSDLDLYVIITDEGYDGFFAARENIIRALGEPLFLEVFRDYGFDLLLFIFADGTEGELGLGRASNFTHIHGGPNQLLN